MREVQLQIGDVGVQVTDIALRPRTRDFRILVEQIRDNRDVMRSEIPDDIAVVLRKVREDVLKNTSGKQQPWEYGSLTGGALVLSAIKPIK